MVGLKKFRDEWPIAARRYFEHWFFFDIEGDAV
jgi:hypothetical protein